MPALVKSVRNIFPSSKCAELQRDCAIIFNSKSISAADDYSSGSTYFVKPHDKPRTALEELAQKIFLYHTDGMEYDPAHSGAEWWSQVIHPEDDIGVHWDRDYGLEEDMGQHVYPLVGTVTYLSNIGAPTAVFSKPGSDLAIEEIVGSISTMVLSCPTIGNHMAFDGTMLHAAPADIFKEIESESSSEEDENDDSVESQPPTLAELLETVGQKRVTFLVNIWVNHVPSQSKKCEAETIKKLKTSLLGDAIQFADAVVDLPTTELRTSDLSRSMELHFNNTETNYDIHIPLPSLDVLNKISSESSVFRLEYIDGASIELAYSEDQPDEEDDGSGSEEDDSSDEGSDEIEEEDRDSAPAIQQNQKRNSNSTGKRTAKPDEAEPNEKRRKQ
jgi:hypothetical protein